MSSMAITFNDICNLLENLEKISIRRPPYALARQTSLSEQAITNWFRLHRNALDDPATNRAAVLSILFPHRRKDRVYGMKATSLAKKLMKILNFNHGQKALLTGWAEGTHGDLGAYIERAMKPWNGTFKGKQTVSLSTINHLLVQLAASSRFSDPATQRQRVRECNTDIELKSTLIKLSNWEAKWVVRLLLREYCTLELDEPFILKQFHFLLPDLLKFQNDFAAAFDMLTTELSCYPPVPDTKLEHEMRLEAARKLKPRIGIKVGRPTFHKAWSFKHCFQMTNNRAWAAEVKYDGEYCEIHINLGNTPNDIQIFSKNGKDATADRQAIHDSIRDALRIGRPECMFKQNCIFLGEMVIYSDKEHTILPFCKIRKHVSRSSSFIGTLQDSLPHEWENLMIVFFDVLLLDDEPVMRRGLQDRRSILRDLVQVIPGRAIRSEWTLVDFKSEHGITDLKQAFARSLAHRQEGLVLKPLHAPYFPLVAELGYGQPGYFIKLKKDYLADMGGERDLGDFAIVGGRFDPQVASKSDIRPLHWTHFYMGCLMNKADVQRIRAKPEFKIVGSLSLDHCIPKPDVQYLNVHGRLRQTQLRNDGNTEEFNFEHSKGYGIRMSAAFKKPFVAEILGGGYEKVQNETFEMLRHPRLTKIHNDRTWEDCVTMSDLERLAIEKWEAPDADKLDGHARDVAVLVKKYVKSFGNSQSTGSEAGSTQETDQQTTQRTSQETPRKVSPDVPDDTVVQETQQTSTTCSTSQLSRSTQDNDIRASRDLRSILIREDTIEKYAQGGPTASTNPIKNAILPTPPISSASNMPSTSTTMKRSLDSTVISPPPSKRRRILTPLKYTGANRSLGLFDWDSQEKTIHIFADEGWSVRVHER